MPPARSIRGRAGRALLPLALLAALLAAPALTLRAQQDDPAPVSLRATAVALARSGVANGDARAVLGAAQLLITAERPSSARVQRVERPQATGGGTRPEERAKADSARADSAAATASAEDSAERALVREAKGSGERLTAAMLLRLASRVAVEQNDSLVAGMAAALAADRAFGAGDAALAAELRRAAQALAGTRGAAGGPIWTDDRLTRNGVAEYRVRFEGGRVRNRIDVTASNPRADLDCYLYENDKLAARDQGREGSCSVEWTQTQSRVLTLRVRNNGADTYYVVMSN
jgi:hypothetical protein